MGILVCTKMCVKVVEVERIADRKHFAIKKSRQPFQSKTDR